MATVCTSLLSSHWAPFRKYFVLQQCRISPVLFHVPGPLRKLLSLHGLLSSSLGFLGQFCLASPMASLLTRVLRSVYCLHLCVLVMFLVLYSLPSVAVHLCISLSLWLDRVSWEQGKGLVCFYIPALNKQHRLSDSRNVCFTVKLK